MKSNNVMKSLIDAVQMKIRVFKKAHTRPTFSSKNITGDLSIDYSIIKLRSECKYVKIFYARENIFAYYKLMTAYFKYTKNKNYDISHIIDALSLYVNGWNTGKIVTDQNINNLDKTIARITRTLNTIQHQFDNDWNNFLKLNNDEDGMVDSTRIPLYRYTTEFPYRKAYFAFFKKERIDSFLIIAHGDINLHYLDTLSDFLSILYIGYEKIGKDDDFAIYRKTQKKLINIIQLICDYIEIDTTLNEKFLKMTNTVINFKVYPD